MYARTAFRGWLTQIMLETCFSQMSSFELAPICNCSNLHVEVQQVQNGRAKQNESSALSALHSECACLCTAEYNLKKFWGKGGIFWIEQA